MASLQNTPAKVMRVGNEGLLVCTLWNEAEEKQARNEARPSSELVLGSRPEAQPYLATVLSMQ